MYMSIGIYIYYKQIKMYNIKYMLFIIIVYLRMIFSKAFSFTKAHITVFAPCTYSCNKELPQKCTSWIDRLKKLFKILYWLSIYWSKYWACHCYKLLNCRRFISVYVGYILPGTGITPTHILIITATSLFITVTSRCKVITITIQT